MVVFRNLGEDIKGHFKCTKCGVAHYNYKKSLNKHLKYKCGKDPQFTCTFCSYKAYWKNNLKDHIKRYHTGTKKELL